MPQHPLPLTDFARATLLAGARCRNAFTRRRARILLAVARGEPWTEIARSYGCCHQSVRHALAEFRTRGLECLRRRRPGPSGDSAWPRDRDADLLTLLRSSPREFGRTRSWWTLSLLARVCHELGWAARVFSPPTLRSAIERQGVSWSEARRWSSEAVIPRRPAIPA